MSSFILRSLGSWIVAHSLAPHIFMQLGMEATMYCMFSSAVRTTPVLSVPLSRSGPPAEWYVSMKSCKYSCAGFRFHMASPEALQRRNTEVPQFKRGMSIDSHLVKHVRSLGTVAMACFRGPVVKLRPHEPLVSHTTACFSDETTLPTPALRTRKTQASKHSATRSNSAQLSPHQMRWCRGLAPKPCVLRSAADHAVLA